MSEPEGTSVVEPKTETIVTPDPPVTPAPVEPTPAVAPAPTPAPAQPPAPDTAVTPAKPPSAFDADRTGHVMSRQSPEAVNRALDTMLKANPDLGVQIAALQEKKNEEAAPPAETPEDMNARMDKLEREINVKDIIMDLGLNRSDAQFLTGNTKQEIYDQGMALKSRIGANDLPSADGGDKPPVTPTEILPVTPKPNEQPPAHQPAVDYERQTVDEAMAALNQAASTGELAEKFPIPENINTNI